jgi:hypothetical protein
MAATPSPPAPGKGGLLKRLNPQQKRMAIALAAGGLLALFVIMRRGGGGGGGTDTATAPISPTDATGLAGGAAADGSTFADNGASMGELNTTLSGLSGQLDALLNQPAPFVDTPGADSPLDVTPVQDPAAPTAPAQVAAVGGVKTAAAALKSKIVTKPSAAHHGQASVYRFVDTDPKKPGYEQKVYLRPASTAKPAVRPQPAAKPAAAPKPQTIVKPSAAHGGKLWVYHLFPGRAPVAVRPATAR